MRKSKEEAEKTRCALLEAALDVFSEKGYAKATFDEIALRAGFTKGAIYWYFRNKADLLCALIAERVLRKQAEITPILPKGNSLDDLLEYFKIWAEVTQEDVRFAKFHRFILCQMEWSEPILERVDKNLKEVKDVHLEKINKVLIESQKNGVLKDGIDIEKTKHIIVSCNMGIMFSALSRLHTFDVVDMVTTGLTVLFNGLKK